MSTKDINSEMQKQWNELAKINPFYAVDSVSEFENYEEADAKIFFERGKKDVERFMHEMDVKDAAGKTLVEIGCGMGRMSNSFAEYFRKVISFDVSDEMLEKAVKFNTKTNIDFRKTDGDSLEPLDNESVDVVFSYIVFQHIIDVNSIYNYIREISRVLVNGGMAYLQMRTFIPDFIEDVTMAKIIKKRLRNLFGIKTSGRRENALGPDSLEERFTAEYSVWAGSRINLPEILVFLKQQNFRIISITGADTQYTYFKLIKLG